MADGVVILHLLFVAFVVLGGFFVIRWPRLALFHLPAAVWGILIEVFGWICPLTPLENSLRMRGGGAAYSGGFVDEYLLPLLYPATLTHNTQYIIAAFVFGINVAAYTVAYRRNR